MRIVVYSIIAFFLINCWGCSAESIGCPDFSAPEIADNTDHAFPNQRYYQFIEAKDFEFTDSDGSIDYSFRTQFNGAIVEHPVRTALFALLMHDLWVDAMEGKKEQRPISVLAKTHAPNAVDSRKEQKYRSKFIEAADHLVSSMKVEKGRGWWPYDFVWKDGIYEYPSGWVSGFGQGIAISVLARAYLSTQNSSYLDAMTLAFASFNARPPENLWVMHRVNHDLWIEEYPHPYDSAHILNGFVYGIWGVLDYYRATKSQAAAHMLEQLYGTLCRNIDQYSSKPWETKDELGSWTFYDLRPGNLRNIFFDFVPQMRERPLPIKFRSLELIWTSVPRIVNDLKRASKPQQHKLTFNFGPWNPFPLPDRDIITFYFRPKASAKGDFLIDRIKLIGSNGRILSEIDVGEADAGVLPTPPAWNQNWGEIEKINNRDGRRVLSAQANKITQAIMTLKDKDSSDATLEITYTGQSSELLELGIDALDGIPLGKLKPAPKGTWQVARFRIPPPNRSRDSRAYGDFSVGIEHGQYVGTLNPFGKFKAGYVEMQTDDHFRMSEAIQARARLQYEIQPIPEGDTVQISLFNGSRNFLAEIDTSRPSSSIEFEIPPELLNRHLSGAYHMVHIAQLTSIIEQVPSQKFREAQKLWINGYESRLSSYAKTLGYEDIQLSGSPGKTK